MVMIISLYALVCTLCRRKTAQRYSDFSEYLSTSVDIMYAREMKKRKKTFFILAAGRGEELLLHLFP